MPLTEMDIDFALRAFALKRTTRSGWTRVRGLTDPESVAEHSWGVAVLALLAIARDPSLDAERLLRVAVAHDLAEAVVGDLVPGDYADAMEKSLREERGLQELLRGLDDPSRQLLADAWRDYEDGASREARLVSDLDKLELAMQARLYEEEGADAPALDEFHRSALARCGDPVLRELVAGLRRVPLRRDPPG